MITIVILIVRITYSLNLLLLINTTYILNRISEGLSGRALRKVALRVHATLIPPELNIRATEFIATMATAVKHIKEEMDALSQTYIFK